MIWMIIFLLLPLLGIAYTGWHIWAVMPVPAWFRAVVVACMVASVLLLFLNIGRSIDRMPLWLARWSYDVGASSIFILLYLTMTFIVLDLGRLVGLVPKAWLHQNVYTTGAIAIALFWVFLLGNVHYHHKTRVELQLPTAKPLAQPVRLLLASDLHLGYHNPRKELARWVDMINAEKPDLVLIAGDIIDMSIRPLKEENMAEEMRRIEAPVYACLGNHEYYSNEPEAQRFFKEAGIQLLRDSATVVGDLCIVGRDDRTNPNRCEVAKLAQRADMQKYTILLDHQPYHLEKAEQAGFDFQFSGHTHYGQVWPISWITDALYECAFGSHQRGHTRYYVSSGLGIWGGKYRIGTRSEYVVATVTPEK
ncbi:MAG: metallophosphoesterase [Prevotella sp.]|nr:metallophosphoesterase [Prevotella sp.]